MRRLTMLIAALLAFGLVTVGCGTIGGSEGDTGDTGGGKAEEPAGEKSIKIGWIPWDEDVVVTHMWKQVLEEKGYEVELVQLDPGPIFTGLSKGDIDLFLDGWLPVTHQPYWEKYSADLEDLGVWYDNAKLALAVPDYVKAKSIEDLKGSGGEFDGRIVGIEAGAGLTRVTKEEAIPQYGLEGEYELVTSSTPAMLTELQKAIDAKDPVVVTLWRPHWAYAKLPIRDLEDPKGAMGKAEEIHAIGRKGFKKDFPELAGWMANFTMDDESLGTLEDVALNQNEGNEEEGVTAWMEDNPDFVTNLTK
ncbi:glycine betaine ABC transporter substrate-binding protein [Actinopolymorpha sp. B11F2]|uniref:glycine betaine ABC transporter substrate-binding protein n=1 Tax=Actinopolymorpha sp. B11F2 TaxID=3160862 RepID=UPI0032E3EE3F